MRNFMLIYFPISEKITKIEANLLIIHFMKKFLLSIMLICLIGLLHAQEKENPRFSLASTHVTNILELESNPVNTMQLSTYIFTAEDKTTNDARIVTEFEITRGKQVNKIDISTLPSGNYFIEIIDSGKRIYRKLFTKE